MLCARWRHADKLTHATVYKLSPALQWHFPFGWSASALAALCSLYRRSSVFYEASIWSITIQLASPLLSTQTVRLGGWISGGSSCYRRVAGCLQQVCKNAAGAIGSEENLPPSLFSLSMEHCLPQFKLVSSDHGNGAHGRTAHAGRPGFLYPVSKNPFGDTDFGVLFGSLAASPPIEFTRPSMCRNICWCWAPSAYSNADASSGTSSNAELSRNVDLQHIWSTKLQKSSNLLAEISESETIRTHRYFTIKTKSCRQADFSADLQQLAETFSFFFFDTPCAWSG